MSSPRTALCLIRHGQTHWNRDGRWQGHAQAALSEEGRAQARAVAASLVAEHAERPWSWLYTSDLLRARETAQSIAEALGLEAIADPRLRELDVGQWSGLQRGEIEARDGERLRAFERGEPGIRAGGGETRLEIRARCRAFVAELAARHAGARILVVTHQGVIRALLPSVSARNAERFEVFAEEIVARGSEPEAFRA